MRPFLDSYTAGQSRKISARGQFVRCLAASLPFSLRVGDGAPFRMQAGLQVPFTQEFTGVEVINDLAGVPQQIEIAISAAGVDDNRFISSGGVRQLGNPGLGANGVVAVAGVAVDVVAANSNRAPQSVIVNHGPNICWLRYAVDPNPGLFEGIPVGVGQTLNISGAQVLRGICPAGSANLFVSEELVA